MCQEQCGFVKVTGRRNAAFISGILLKKAIKIQVYVHMFYRLSKCTDEVRYEELFEMTWKTKSIWVKC